MTGRSLEILEFLESKRAERQLLAEVLGSDLNEVYVYYLASAANVVRILEPGGGIRPRNQVSDYVDLSGESVQSRRTRKVRLIGEGGAVRRDPHDCVCLFLNPLNSTLFMFRRNALVRHPPERPLERLVCILEVSLSDLLEIPGTYWGIAEKNLAAAGVTVTTGHGYEEFKWGRIYSLQRADKYFRAAEFVVRPGNGTDIVQVPAHCVQRVLAFRSDLDRVVWNNCTELPRPIVTLPGKLRADADPLYYDRKWVAALRDLIAGWGSGQSLGAALRRISGLEDELGHSLAHTFESHHRALSRAHDVQHVTRTVFWVLILGECLRAEEHPLHPEEESTALYAAFFHDSARSDDSEDWRHGGRAAHRFGPVLRERLDNAYVKRGLIAIACHSKDDPDGPDVIWQIVKDADALDRERFRDSGGGCDVGFLRLPCFANGRASLYIEAAYRLYRLTDYLPGGENACQAFADEVLGSLRAVAACADADPDIKQMVHEIEIGYEQRN